MSVSFPVSLNGVTNLQVIHGSFTPANNTKFIAQGLAATSPSFIIFCCDGVANLTTDNVFMTQLPVNKVAFITMPLTAGGNNPFDSFLLDGTAANPYPMAQGVALNYTLIIGQATVV